ncbi:hypothetical protein HN630_00155 [archaeon]|nr:hypothetical protein [archaeon]
MHQWTNQDIAIHEAAHYVASYRLNPSRVRDVISIDLKKGSLGRVIEESFNEDYDNAESEIIILLAGYSANIEFSKISKNDAKLGATDDFRKADYLLSLIESSIEVLIDRAIDIVRQNEDAISLLSKELVDSKELASDEADLIILVADGDPHASDALQSLRYIKRRH